MAKVKITYFNIEGAAEKVRLALVMTGTEFEDNRIDREAWQELKPKTPYGQVPIMEITEADGVTKTLSQSFAMLRWVALKFDSTGTLYPTDPEKMLEVEEVLGLSDDIARMWMPLMMMGMMPTKFGHPEEWPEKDATVKKLREAFVEENLPGFMGHFSKKLEATGAFFCGATPTIADLTILPQLRYFTNGKADHVPSTVLEPYPAITGWMARMHELPQIKKWYSL